MWKRAVLGGLLILFLAQTARALFDHSYVGFFLIGSANSATQLMMLDLVLALGLIVVWLVLDARANGGSFLPFVGITLLFGIAGPLAYLVTRGWGRGRQRLAASVVLAVLAIAAGSFWNYADLRTASLKRAPEVPDRRGTELLRLVTEQHGIEAWNRHTTMELTAIDSWRGQGWWSAPVQRFRSQALLGTFTSRVELLDGPGAGEIRGVQAWAPYRQAQAAESVTFVETPAPEITFYLPTLQYFNELPFRLLAADFVRYAGEAEHRGRRYDLLFATWGTIEPNPDHDQYLLWIDRETRRIEMVQYTVRDLLSMSSGPTRAVMKAVGTGTIHFDDYREVDGVWFPFEQTITLAEPALTQHPVRENYFHRLVVEEVRFDSVPREALIPSSHRLQPGDRKAV